MGEQTVKKTYCQFCSNVCGVLVTVEDGKVVSIKGNPENPLSRGFVCERVRLAPQWLYHPGQLMHPLKRTGRRGEGKWERITWDQAFSEIGQKLLQLKDKYGAETLGFFEGTYRGNDYWPRGRFASLFGNPHNIFAPGIICGINDMAINMAVMGDVTTYAIEMSNSRCVVYWGSDPSESNMRGWAGLLRKKKKGDLKVIVVDPRQTKTSDAADIWLRLRPGTDTALALAWLNVIINEGLYNKEFVAEWTVGFDQLKARVQEYPPERVAEITGVPAEKIVEAARTYATHGPACMPYGVAIDQLGLNGTRAEQCKIALRAITGNLGTLGGHLITRPGEPTNGGKFITEAELSLMHLLPMEQRRKQMGFDVCRLVTLNGWSLMEPHLQRVYGVPAPVTVQIQAHTTMLWRSILTGKPYPVKALIAWGSNPLAWAGNTKLVFEALKSDNLELHVVQELFMTPSAQLADYVLPAASWLERDLCTNMMDFGSLLRAGEKAIPPMGTRLDIYEFFRGLALAVGPAGALALEDDRRSQQLPSEAGWADLQGVGREVCRVSGHLRPAAVEEDGLPYPFGQDRALFQHPGETGLRPAALLRGASGEPAAGAGCRQGIPAHSEHGRQLHAHVPFGVHAPGDGRPGEAPRSADGHTSGHCRQPGDSRRRLGLHRDPAGMDQAAGQIQSGHAAQRGQLPGQLVVPGEPGQRAGVQRRLRVQRQRPDSGRSGVVRRAVGRLV